MYKIKILENFSVIYINKIPNKKIEYEKNETKNITKNES